MNSTMRSLTLFGLAFVTSYVAISLYQKYNKAKAEKLSAEDCQKLKDEIDTMTNTLATSRFADEQIRKGLEDTLANLKLSYSQKCMTMSFDGLPNFGVPKVIIN